MGDLSLASSDIYYRTMQLLYFLQYIQINNYQQPSNLE